MVRFHTDPHQGVCQVVAKTRVHPFAQYNKGSTMIEQIVRTVFPGTGENVTVEEIKDEIIKTLNEIENGEFEIVVL